MFSTVTDSEGNFISNENGEILVIDQETNTQLWIPQGQIQLVHDTGSGASINDIQTQSAENVLDSGTDEDEKTDKTWNHNDTLLLISLIQKYEKQFETSMKKVVWQKITKSLNDTAKKNYTPLNVENKWKSLKRTYKSLKIKSLRTGTQRKYWEYYRVMDELMGKKPEINPPALASSSTGVRSQKITDKETEIEGSTSEDSNNNRPSTSRAVTTTDDSPKTKFFRKRNSPNVNDRHEAKMKRQDRFLELFEKFIDKLN